VDIVEGTKIFITDNAWTGTKFRTNEGTLGLDAPQTIAAGTNFGYGEGILYGDLWTDAVDAGFSLAATGDSVIVYTTDNTEYDLIMPLSAISFDGPWTETGLNEDAYTTDVSALPEPISPNSSVALDHRDNYVYVGPLEGTKSVLQAAIINSGNWLGSYSDLANLFTNSLLAASTAHFRITSFAAYAKGHGALVVIVLMAFLLSLFLLED
jgi:hypothetical protein